MHLCKSGPRDMIPHVNPTPGQESRVVWSFCLAAALALIAGIVPVVSAGTSSRIAVVWIPLTVAAAALAGCALLHQSGRTIAAGLYFIAGLAIVYGILSMLAVPLRLAVVGTCPATLSHCPLGYEQPLTGGESTGLAFGTAIGIVALFTGFFGLLTMYRHAQVPYSSPPPARRVEPPPTPHPQAQPSTETAPQPAAAEPAPAPVAQAPEPMAELPAPEPMAELPAPDEPLELPAPAPEPELSAAAAAPAAAKPVTPRKPRVRRTPKVHLDTPPPPEPEPGPETPPTTSESTS
jgi:hypothetical protein